MSSNTTQRAAPQLLFDDGSRAIQEDEVQADPMAAARDPSIPVHEYYEIERLLKELHELREASDPAKWRNRIALQFPDELLIDAPEVCWEFEQSLPDALVFVLGDTTYQSCCPDVVAAQHLDADCIIHYGHACLSHSTLPVLYSFGRQPISIEKMVQAVASQKQQDGATNNLLLLYEVKYAHAIEKLKNALASVFETVTMGRIPKSHAKTVSTCGPSACGCSTTASASSASESKPSENDIPVKDPEPSPRSMTLGGLEIPPCDNWVETTLLFIGQDEASRPLQNIMLRFLTDPEHAPKAYWTWNPSIETLSTQVSPKLSRILSRRFYLVQKAKLAKIFGILVAHPSDQTTRPVVQHLQALLQVHGAAQYNFMVGKINPNKLANFAEVDAYCLVACPEHALLENERSDYATPILTPLEVAMALGGIKWGTLPYSLDANDFLRETANIVKTSADKTAEADDDSDAPYFNPVTGRFESSDVKKEDEPTDLNALPGKGQLTTYQSAAADFLKQRAYQGLTVEAGETAVQAAVPGQQGIASDYGNR